MVSVPTRQRLFVDRHSNGRRGAGVAAFADGPAIACAAHHDQQRASTIPLAVAGIAIIIVGLSWAVMGWMQARTAAAVIIGIAVVGSYSTIASALVH
jgi:hypothetical protein